MKEKGISRTDPSWPGALAFTARRRWGAGVLVRVFALAAALLATVTIATEWDQWVGLAAVQRTDNAYVAGDLTPLSARVQGLVETVAVDDYQRVQAGELLVQIRDDD